MSSPAIIDLPAVIGAVLGTVLGAVVKTPHTPSFSMSYDLFCAPTFSSLPVVETSGKPAAQKLYLCL
jgi:hypothetical protein